MNSYAQQIQMIAREAQQQCLAEIKRTDLHEKESISDLMTFYRNLFNIASNARRMELIAEDHGIFIQPTEPDLFELTKGKTLPEIIDFLQERYDYELGELDSGRGDAEIIPINRSAPCTDHASGVTHVVSDGESGESDSLPESIDEDSSRDSPLRFRDFMRSIHPSNRGKLPPDPSST